MLKKMIRVNLLGILGLCLISNIYASRVSSFDVGKIRYLRNVSGLHGENLIDNLMEFYRNLEAFLVLFVLKILRFEIESKRSESFCLFLMTKSLVTRA